MMLISYSNLYLDILVDYTDWRDSQTILMMIGLY